MIDRHALGQIRRHEFVGIVRHERDALHAFRPYTVGDGIDADRTVHRLAAGHGDRVVEQDLVGDVGAGRDGLPDRHGARMVIGAFAEILEDVALAGELGRGRPVHAFAAHLDQRRGLPVHPARHEMAADACQRFRAFRHLGRGVVRAAGAEIGRARCARNRDHALCVGREGGDVLCEVEIGEDRVEALRQNAGEKARRELARPGDEALALFVVLADHALGLRARIIVKVFLELAFDDAALFLDHEDLALALHEFHGVVERQRPHHADLVDVDAMLTAGGLVEADEAQGLHQIEMGLAGGNDAIGCIWNVVDPPVDGVRLGEGIDGVLLRLHALFDLRPRQIRPAVVQAARRRREIGLVELARRAQFNGGAGLDDLRYGLEADPHAGEATECIAVLAEFEILGDARRMQRRHEPAHEGDIGLVRHRR